MATGSSAAAEEAKTGGAESSKKKPTPSPTTQCTNDFADSLARVSVKASKLEASLKAMLPRDSGGNLIYVTTKQTYDAWLKAQADYANFERALAMLQSDLPDPASKDTCAKELLQQSDLLAESEALILDQYPELQEKFQALLDRLNKADLPHVEVDDVEATDNVNVKVLATYAGALVATKNFHFEPSFGILSSSAGFLLTQLPARAYSSVTAPNPADPTTTQNVLSVDNGRGTRPALTVLLTGNIPQVNSHNFGLGFSAGPVFDISNGKADTSRFGFFVGPSVRLTPWIFLTPGFHFGEFADFPQGFTHPGQVIPANTGTPVPVKRFTGRFAFGVTFKLKDLGSVITSGNSNKD
jgi:hypothetical protein